MIRFKIFICETLNPISLKTDFICCELKCFGFLQNSYTVNGFLRIFGDSAEKKLIKIFHEPMLQDPEAANERVL